MTRPGPGPGPLHALPGLDPRPDEDVSVLEDRFAFVQATRGWRFGFDAVALARHVLEGPRGDLLEVGTGCGVVAILLAGWGWPGRIVAVEIQPDLADRARRNVAANGLSGSVTIVEGDARRHRELLPEGTFARIVANPPYWRLGSGRTNPHPERAAARHEFHIDVTGLLGVVRDRLAPGGVASILYPPERLPDVEAAAGAAGLSLIGQVDLRPAPDRPPEVVILDLAAGRGLPRAPGSSRVLGRPGAP